MSSKQWQGRNEEINSVLVGSLLLPANQGCCCNSGYSMVHMRSNYWFSVGLSFGFHCRTGLGLEVHLVFSLWLVHPFFSGFERVYDYWINKRLLPVQEQVDHILSVMREWNWRWVTIVVQYVMLFFDKSVAQINEIVRQWVSFYM